MGSAALRLSILTLVILILVREMGICAIPRRPRRAATMPGTNFCGPGNFSGSKNDLGWLVDTDRCCRDHDMCPQYIDAGETKFGNLKNDGSISRFHCDCDTQFYQCLKDNIENGRSAQSSGIILYIYFAWTSVKCFKNEYPIIKCETYDEYSKDKCLKYYVNGSSSPVYQWFDTLSNVVIIRGHDSRENLSQNDVVN